MSRLSERLYSLRKERGLMQEELAEALGVSRQAVSKWEMGTGTPTLDNLIAISDFFGVSLDSLVKDSPDPPETDVPDTPEAPPQMPEYRAEVGHAKEYVPPMKTVINAALLIAAHLFSYAIINGLQYFITLFAGQYSADALLVYVRIQPYLTAAMNLVFCFPLYYLMTAVFRDGVCLVGRVPNRIRRLSDALVLWLISTAQLALLQFIAQGQNIYGYYLAAPALNGAVWLVFYLYLTRAKGFNRRAKVLFPALFAIFAVAAVFTAIIYVTVSSDTLEVGTRLARTSWTVRAMNAVTPAVSLAALTVLYDYGRKEI